MNLASDKVLTVPVAMRRHRYTYYCSCCTNWCAGFESARSWSKQDRHRWQLASVLLVSSTKCCKLSRHLQENIC